MLRPAIAAACAVLTLLAGCGEGDDDGRSGGGAAPAPDRGAKLTVKVRPAGPDGPLRERRIECERLGPGADEPACRRLAGLTAKQVAPVPESTVCTSIYGGPAVARVTGTIEGVPVDVRFGRQNGCEIARWDRNQALLGPPASRP